MITLGINTKFKSYTYINKPYFFINLLRISNSKNII